MKMLYDIIDLRLNKYFKSRFYHFLKITAAFFILFKILAQNMIFSIVNYDFDRCFLFKAI